MRKNNPELNQSAAASKEQGDVTVINNLTEEKFKETLPKFEMLLAAVEPGEMDIFNGGYVSVILDRVQKHEYSLEDLKRAPVQIRIIFLKALN